MTVKAEAQDLSIVVESSLGVAPTTGWLEQRFLPGGLKGLSPQIKSVRDNSVSKQRQLEPGSKVGHDSKPSINFLACRDSLDNFGSGIVLALEKFAGGGKRWYPTAVTSTGYTVDAQGDRTAKMLVHALGFTTAANNGLKTLGSGSIATEVKASGLTAETVSPALSARLEPAGWEGASGDITIDGSGNLTSTSLDFTTIGANVGQVMKLGDGGAGTSFATSAYNGFGMIASITAHLITFAMRTWTVGSLDAGTGKTIRLLYGSWLRNVAIDSPDYIEPSYGMEVTQPGSGAAAATEYVYPHGNVSDMVEIDASLESLLKITLSFVGTKCDKPTTTRVTGPSIRIPKAAYAPYNTVGNEFLLGLYDTSERVVSNKINNWKLQFKNNASGVKYQGTEGAGAMNFGMAEASGSADVFMEPPATGASGPQAAIVDYTTHWFRAGFANAEGGFIIDCPEVKLSGGDPNAAENMPVMLPLVIEANRSRTYGYSMAISRFPYLP